MALHDEWFEHKVPALGMSARDADIQAIKRLLTDVIDSFEKLEIAVHVHRASFVLAPVRDIAKAISMPVDEVDKCMQQLLNERVLDAAGPWRASLDALVKMYDDDRIEVLNLMTRTALDRVRKHAARAFADAFVIRPKKKGDPDA
jgi:hypothetical protein